jgi:hypothetical protein
MTDIVFTASTSGGLRLVSVADDSSGVFSAFSLKLISTVSDLGYVDEIGFSMESTTEDIFDDTGSVVANLPGDTKIKLTGMFLQSDVELLDFLRDSTDGYYYRVYYKMSDTGAMNGGTQELFGAICTIKPMFEVKSKAKKIPFEMNFLENASAIAMVGLTALFGSVIDTATVVAKKYYEITG